MRRVDIELIGLGIVRQPIHAGSPMLGYHLQRTALGDGTTPDQQARAMAPEGTEVLHSTSWRPEDDGTLVLSYAAAPWSDPRALVPLVAPSIVCSGDPLTPTPDDLHAHHVAAHAARHLAYLLGRDPGITAAAERTTSPQFWNLLRQLAEPPTGTHREAHLRAAASSTLDA